MAHGRIQSERHVVGVRPLVAPVQSRATECPEASASASASAAISLPSHLHSLSSLSPTRAGVSGSGTVSIPR